MIRYAFFINEKWINFLKSFDEITVSEHLRKAVSDYMEKLKNLNVSVSPTKRVGDIDE